MSLLDRINKEIERTEATIKVFEAPNAAASEYQKGWNSGTLAAWRRILVALQEIRKFITEGSTP